jgi:hypothetical protein
MFGLGRGWWGSIRGDATNALDVRLAALSLSFPDLPPAFDGYRILQLVTPISIVCLNSVGLPRLLASRS